jgi:hypothetical protein
MPNRVIKSTAHAAGQTLSDTLRSLFALELFAPSQIIFLTSPWITDFVVLDNSFGQYRALLPDVNGQVRLSAMLNSLAEQGTTIRILNQTNTSRDFLQRLHPSIQCKARQNLHEKSLLTDHFYLRGSMNFTHSGLNRNDEHVELSTESDDLAQARVAAQALWQEVSA